MDLIVIRQKSTNDDDGGDDGDDDDSDDDSDDECSEYDSYDIDNNNK